MRVERIEIALPRLPEACEGLTVALLTDLHAGFLWHRTETVRLLVGMVNDLQADLILVLGDVIHWHYLAPRYVPLLGALHARYGVWACLGNHERGSVWFTKYLAPKPMPSLEDWRRLYTEAGLHLLVNEAAPLEVEGARLWLAGVDDASSNLDDLCAALVEVPPEECCLVLSHSPDLVDDPEIARVDLVVAGHTHGGQVVLPVIGPLFASTRDPAVRGSGLSRMGDTWLYVSRGSGEGLPVRYNSPRELSLLTLRRAEPG